MTINSLIGVLIEDVTRCQVMAEKARLTYTRTKSDEVAAKHRRTYEYHARQFFRATFAFIEGMVYDLKTRHARFCEREGIELSAGEADFAHERDFKLTETGTVVEQFAHIRLVENIRLTITLMQRARGINPEFDANVGWWSALRSSIRVRDRLTHPKRLEDLDVSDQEVADLVTAYRGLLDYLSAFTMLQNSKQPNRAADSVGD